MTDTRAGSQPAFDQARDELFSHILRCGVIDASDEHQKDWFDDTMEYLAERYLELPDKQLDAIRVLGERYCRPVVNRTPADKTTTTEAENEPVVATT